MSCRTALQTRIFMLDQWYACGGTQSSPAPLEWRDVGNSLASKKVAAIVIRDGISYLTDLARLSESFSSCSTPAAS
jgi:hypothetical protein